MEFFSSSVRPFLERSISQSTTSFTPTQPCCMQVVVKDATTPH